MRDHHVAGRTARHRRIRLTTGAATILMLVTAGACARPGGTDPTSADVADPPVATGTVTPTPATTPPSSTPTPTRRTTRTPTPPRPAAGAIPNSAFFVPPGNPPGVKATEGGPFLPALFCGLSPTHELVLTRRTRTVPYYADESQTAPRATVYQTITVYKAGGASKFMLQLRTVTEGCQNDPVGGSILDYQPLPWPSGPGDDYLLVERTTDPTGPPAPTVSYLFAIRIGDVVTVINLYGRDGQNADAMTARSIADRAAATINQWRR
jgi:hypothetical protein